MDDLRGMAYATPTCAGLLLFFWLDAGQRRVSLNDLRGLVARFPDPFDVSNTAAALLASMAPGHTELLAASTANDVDPRAVLRAAHDAVVAGAAPAQYYAYVGGAFSAREFSADSRAAFIELLGIAVSRV